MDIVLGIALSLHIGLDNDYNSIHPFVMGEYNNFIGGAYLNSENNISPFLAYKFNLTDQFSIDIGAVGGYNSYSVLPMFKLNYDINQNFVFFVAPAVENNKSGMILGVQISR
jgi:hypothetical protein